ncbi:MAG: hypothetical protein AAF125_23530, partial [Chloroflexota bacterium]
AKTGFALLTARLRFGATMTAIGIAIVVIVNSGVIDFSSINVPSVNAPANPLSEIMGPWERTYASAQHGDAITLLNEVPPGEYTVRIVHNGTGVFYVDADIPECNYSGNTAGSARYNFTDEGTEELHDILILEGCNCEVVFVTMEVDMEWEMTITRKS